MGKQRSRRMPSSAASGRIPHGERLSLVDSGHVIMGRSPKSDYFRIHLCFPVRRPPARTQRHRYGDQLSRLCNARVPAKQSPTVPQLFPRPSTSSPHATAPVR